MTVSPVVVVTTEDPLRSRRLAEQLTLPLLQPNEILPRECIAYLGYRDERLQLFPADAKQSGPICVDFAGNVATYRLQSGAELIVKAVRGRSKNSLRVIDATAGLGRDSFVLAAHGFEVTLIERNAVVAALLGDGLLRAKQSSAAEIVARMQLVAGDALAYMGSLPDAQRPDVIYLDPMFAHNDKTALVKKEMRLFRQLFEGDQLDNKQSDEVQLFQGARACARLRVVVKRAVKASYLAEVEPGYSLAGKAVRFDVYPS